MLNVTESKVTYMEHENIRLSTEAARPPTGMDNGRLRPASATTCLSPHQQYHTSSHGGVIFPNV